MFIRDPGTPAPPLPAVSSGIVQQVLDIAVALLLLEGRLHVKGVAFGKGGEVTLSVGGPALQADITTTIQL